jgi:hypothetical protein
MGTYTLMGHIRNKKKIIYTHTQTQQVTHINNTSLHTADKNNNDINPTLRFIGPHKKVTLKCHQNFKF